MKTLFNIKIDFEKSQGAFVFDKNSNKSYLDLFSMYSSLPLGYNHPVFDDSFFEKVKRVAHLRMTNNMFLSDELLEFIGSFRPHVFSDYMHFTCTGALAIESAIKCAMEVKKVKNPMVLSLKKSFHGVNSWGFLTDRFAGTAARMENFPRNNWLNLSFEEVEDYFSKQDLTSLVAFVLEPIQCTAGDLYVPPEQIKRIRELCTAHGICLIVDEIQTGFGVTGTMWYSEKLGIQPDILVFGKKAQICGLVTVPQFNECLISPIQKLEVTYDGDLIDAIRSVYVLKAYREGNLVEKATLKSQFFRSLLQERVLNYRSEGLLVAFDFETREVRDQFTRSCFEEGLLCNGTGEKAVRMRPNLAISDSEMNRAGELIKLALKKIGR